MRKIQNLEKNQKNQKKQKNQSWKFKGLGWAVEGGKNLFISNFGFFGFHDVFLLFLKNP